MKIVVGSDHAGDNYKRNISEYLTANGHIVELVGSMGNERFDYPLASDAVAQALQDGRAEMGILVCGSGIGVAIRANRYPFIRAANCTTIEMAQLAREHNHANVLCIGERIISKELAIDIVRTFLETQPDLGERHVHRVELLGTNIEQS